MHRVIARWELVCAPAAFTLLAASWVVQGDGRNQWLSGTLLNTSFLLFGVLLANRLIEGWQQETERRRWVNVDVVVHARCLRAALQVPSIVSDIPRLRDQLTADKAVSSEVGRDGGIPSAQEMFDDPKRAASLVSSQLTPLVSDLHERAPSDWAQFNEDDQVGLSDLDWHRISGGARSSLLLLAQITPLSSDRISPALLEAILRLEDAATSFLGRQGNWGPSRSGKGELIYQKESLGSLERLIMACGSTLEQLGKETARGVTTSDRRAMSRPKDTKVERSTG